MAGLMDLIDDYSLQSTTSWHALQLGLDTIQGQARSSYPILEAVISHNSGTNRDLTELVLQNHFDSLEKASGKKKGGKPKLIMMSAYEARAIYIDLLQSDRRFMKPLKLVGGWEALGYQNGDSLIPWIVDKDCPAETILTPDLRFLNLYRAGNFDWMERDGSILHRKIDSNGEYDAYVAKLFTYMNQGCKSFRNQGAIRDISES